MWEIPPKIECSKGAGAQEAQQNLSTDTILAAYLYGPCLGLFPKLLFKGQCPGSLPLALQSGGILNSISCSQYF